MKRNNTVGILLLVPTIVFLCGLMLYPVANGVVISFYRQPLYAFQNKFVGLANYVYLWHNKAFIQAFYNGFIWVAGTISLQFLLGIGSALILNKRFVGRGLARACTLLPFFMPAITILLVWRWMYNDQTGVINYLLQTIHLIKEPILWLSTPKLAMFALIIMASWRFFPFVTINVLARLQTITPQLGEAARLDGANVFQSFFYVTLPQLRGVLLVVLLLRTVWMFNKFDEIWIVTKGGPVGSTTTLPLLAYKMGFSAMRMGRGATVTTSLFMIVATVSILYITLGKPAETNI